MGNLELLERAFELAARGDISSIRELREALRQDGVSLIDLGQLSGRALMKQLTEEIAKARRARG